MKSGTLFYFFFEILVFRLYPLILRLYIFCMFMNQFNVVSYEFPIDILYQILIVMFIFSCLIYKNHLHINYNVYIHISIAIICAIDTSVFLLVCLLSICFVCGNFDIHKFIYSHPPEVIHN